MRGSIRKVGMLVALILVLCMTVSAVVLNDPIWFSSPEDGAKASAREIRTPRQAYELCYADSMDQPRVAEGIESGWELDNRAGEPKLSNSGNGLVSDIMTDEHSRLLRTFNRVSEGKLDIRFAVAYIFGFDGNILRLSDENGEDAYCLFTKNGAFYLKTAAGEERIAEKDRVGPLNDLEFRILIDFDKGISKTYISNVDCGEWPLTGSGITGLSFETTDESRNITEVKGGFIEANYAVFEDFSHPTWHIHPEFQSNEDGRTIWHEWDKAALNSGRTTARTFEPLGGTVCFSLATLLPEGGDASFGLWADQNPVVRIEAKNGKFFANGREIDHFSDKIWYNLRMEADTEAQRAVIKLNNKVVDTVDFLTETNYVSKVTFGNAGQDKLNLDDIMVYNLLDYDVPQPVIPEGADAYTLGINVCSLWENGSHWGWGTISPYEDLEPVLGYYDECLPETADWEIKFMAEHGIDFQAFCWFASSENQPLKSSAKHLDRAFLNAKYGDMMKFCLLWEAANGSIPADSNAFRSYYVPCWIENYFSNSSYMIIDNKPVLAIFGADRLIERFGTSLKTEFDYMREEVKKLGFDGMIILDCNGADQNIKQYGFDGWYAYNWHINGYSLEVNQARNRDVQSSRDVYAVPTISVGFNNVGWSGERHPLMTVEDFRAANEWVKDTYLEECKSNQKYEDWAENFVMLSTWNEYGEGTYLMPCEKTNGFGYLDALREVYTQDGTHTDVVPTPEQKASITHNYPQNYHILRNDGLYGNYVPALGTDYIEHPWTATGAWETYRSDGWGFKVGTVSSAGTQFASTSADPAIRLNSGIFGKYGAEDVAYIRVKASGIPKDSTMQLFFVKNGGMTEADSIKITSQTDGEQEFVFKVGEHAGWDSSVTELRLDPVDRANVTFTIQSIILEGKTGILQMSVNGQLLSSKVQMETTNGVVYMPFEPGISMIHHYLYTYYDWDRDAKTLTLFRDKTSYQFTDGSNQVLVNGTAKQLDGAVYLRNGIPMLPLYSFAEAMGLQCVRNMTGSQTIYDITTPERCLFDCLDRVSRGVWEFNNQTGIHQWRPTNAEAILTDDSLRMISTSNDPILSISNLSFDCSKYKTLEICCKWEMEKDSDRLGFYFETDENPGLNEKKHVTTPISRSSDGYQTIRLPISDNAFWSGNLTQLRFDPFDAAGTIDIAYIRFVEADEPYSLLQDDAEGEQGFSGSMVELVTDPRAEKNKCYYAHSNDARRWLYATNQNVQFKAGMTYQIDFDVMLDPNGHNESSQIICNMRYYDSRTDTSIVLNHQDHIVMQMNVSKADGWVHYSVQHTVPDFCTDRSQDAFCIYSNPQGDYTTSYYFDNVRVTEIGENAGRTAVYNLNMYMFGNSLLQHEVATGIGWPNCWGMAASAEDKDYAHQLHTMLAAEYGEVPFEIKQISNYERAIDNNTYTTALQSYEADFAASCQINPPEIVTIQMGENVNNAGQERYQAAVEALVGMVRKHAPDSVIVLCTPFWGGDWKINAIRAVGSKTAELKIAEVHTLNQDQYKAYNSGFSHSGVQAHPGDLGMLKIAELIDTQLDSLISEKFQPAYAVRPSAMRLTADHNQISEANGTLQLTPCLTPAYADSAMDWSSSDERIATVDSSGRVTAVNNGTVVITATSKVNRSLRATYRIDISGQAPSYTITYNANGDGVNGMPEPTTLARGTTALSTAVPTRNYYFFTGWSLSPDGETIAEVDVTGDTTVYAIWREARWWDFDTVGNMQGITVENGFHVKVINGELTATATGFHEPDNVLAIQSPALNLTGCTAFTLTMQNTVASSSIHIPLRLEITTDQQTYTFTDMATHNGYQVYQFDLTAVAGTITGFRLIPTDRDCSVNIQEMGFQGGAN